MISPRIPVEKGVSTLIRREEAENHQEITWNAWRSSCEMSCGPLSLEIEGRTLATSFAKFSPHCSPMPQQKNIHLHFARTKGQFCERAVLASVPSFQFWVSSFRFLVTSFRFLGCGEHPPKPRFWKPPFCVKGAIVL